MLGNHRIYWLLFAVIVVTAVFFRFWQLGSNPPSLYWEEVALGYDAYSILKTGRDHHGHFLPIVAFESFGDWKPSLYFYSLVPSIAVFGLNELAVRVPSALSGVLIVMGMGWLVRLLFQFSATKPTLSQLRSYQLVAMAITAISPWAIIFSRGGWEVNLATCLILWGAVSFLFYLQKLKMRRTSKIPWLLFSVIFLSLSMYAYHAARTVAPAVGIGLLTTWIISDLQDSKRKGLAFITDWIRTHSGQLIVPAIFLVVLLSPLLFSLGSNQAQQRFNETNIFADLTLLQKSQSLQAAAGGGVLPAIVYHRFAIYGHQILANILTHFDLSFLFLSGDVNVRHSIQFVGQLYHIEVFFLILGAYVFIKKYKKWYWLFGLWLGVGLLTVSITKSVPHALRILPTLPVWLTWVSLGVIAAYEQCIRLCSKLIHVKKYAWLTILVALFFVGVYTAETVMFWRFYSTIYPKRYAHEFGDGYKQMIASVGTLSNQYPELPVFIIRDLGRPAMYYWFYTQADPTSVQALDATVDKDQGEFLDYYQVHFPLKTDFITRSGIVAVPPRSFKLLLGEDVEQTKLPVEKIYNSAGALTWVVFRFE